MVPQWIGAVRRDSRGPWHRSGYRDCDIGFTARGDNKSRTDGYIHRSCWRDRFDVVFVLVLAGTG